MVCIAKNTLYAQFALLETHCGRNTEKPRVRAIDGSHGVWPRPPLPNRKIGNYPDYFRFWAERAIIAIISDHCRWTENFFIGQHWVDNKLSQPLTGICGDHWSGLTVMIEWVKWFKMLQNDVYYLTASIGSDDEVIGYFSHGWQFHLLLLLTISSPAMVDKGLTWVWPGYWAELSQQNNFCATSLCTITCNCRKGILYSSNAQCVWHLPQLQQREVAWG